MLKDYKPLIYNPAVVLLSQTHINRNIELQERLINLYHPVSVLLSHNNKFPMSKFNQAPKKALWKSLSEKQTETVKGGGYPPTLIGIFMDLDVWCNRTRHLMS